MLSKEVNVIRATVVSITSAVMYIYIILESRYVSQFFFGVFQIYRRLHILGGLIF